MNDSLVICSAESERQVQAIRDHIEKVLEEKGHRLLGLEGTEVGAWVLMDYEDVVAGVASGAPRLGKERSLKQRG